jgi:hypothetical protein
MLRHTMSHIQMCIMPQGLHCMKEFTLMSTSASQRFPASSESPHRHISSILRGAIQAQHNDSSSSSRLQIGLDVCATSVARAGSAVHNKNHQWCHACICHNLSKAALAAGRDWKCIAERLPTLS